MKTYIKPTIEFIELKPEERLACESVKPTTGCCSGGGGTGGGPGGGGPGGGHGGFIWWCSHTTPIWGWCYSQSYNKHC